MEKLNSGPSPRYRAPHRATKIQFAPISSLTVRARLIGLGLIVSALLTAVAAVAISGFGTVKSDVSTAYAKQQIPIQQRNMLSRSYEGWLTADDQTNMYAGLGVEGQSDSVLGKATWQQVIAGRAQAVSEIQSLRKLGLSAPVVNAVNNLTSDLTKYNSYTTTMYRDVAAGQARAGITAITVSNAAVSNDVQADYNELRNWFTKDADLLGKVLPTVVDSSRRQSIAVGVGAILIAIVLICLIIRSIIVPLRKLERAADRVAQGRVDVTLDVHGHDEISRVAESFRAVIAHLKDVSEAARQFADGYIAVPLAPKSDGDELGHAFVAMKGELGAALGEHAATEKLGIGLGELLEAMVRLEDGLAGMCAGDMTAHVEASLQPITPEQEGEEVGFVAERYNEMIASAQASLERYNELRERFRAKLGDQSSLEALTERLEQLRGGDLNDLQGALRAMNDGDLTVTVLPTATRIEAGAGVEIGHLADVFNEMLANTQAAISRYNEMRERLSEMLTAISSSSEQVSSTSTQLASSSNETGRAIAEIVDAVGSVAQGAEEQVRSLEQAAQVSNELAEASRISAEVAGESSAAAAHARTLARQGVVTAENASAAMQAIRDSSETTSVAIRSLSDKSEQIGGIVATITALADQTNLLALNAAIEAARAGEHGNGFAVVADEVRHLADESRGAAATIQRLIEEIQSETAMALETVERSSSQTRAGAATVEEAKEAFLEIGQSVEDTTDRVEQIAASIKQIAASGTQMREAMSTIAALAQSSSASAQQVSAGTEQTSASTQQTAASAQGLADTATQLDRLVSQFTLA